MTMRMLSLYCRIELTLGADRDTEERFVRFFERMPPVSYVTALPEACAFACACGIELMCAAV